MSSFRCDFTVASTCALSTIKRSYPTSEVRGRSGEDPMPKGWRPRCFTPRPRSGAAGEIARLRLRRNDREDLPKSKVRGGGQAELPYAGGQGHRGGGPAPRPRSRGCAGAGGPRGAIHMEGQEGRQCGDTPHPR